MKGTRWYKGKYKGAKEEKKSVTGWKERNDSCFKVLWSEKIKQLMENGGETVRRNSEGSLFRYSACKVGLVDRAPQWQSNKS